MVVHYYLLSLVPNCQKVLTLLTIWQGEPLHRALHSLYLIRPCRAVVIIGLPFANLGSPELKERMNYMKRLGAKVQQPDGKKVDAASELYLNMCMNSVNQSIGTMIPCLSPER